MIEQQQRTAPLPALSVGDTVFVRLWVPMYPGRFGRVIQMVSGGYTVEFPARGDEPEAREGYDREMLIKVKA